MGSFPSSLRPLVRVHRTPPRSVSTPETDPEPPETRRVCGRWCKVSVGVGVDPTVSVGTGVDPTVSVRTGVDPTVPTPTSHRP